MKAASSVARKNTADQVPGDLFPSQRAAGGLRLQDRLREGVPDCPGDRQPRSDQVDCDAVLAEFPGQGASETQHTRLGCDVGHLAPGALEHGPEPKAVCVHVVVRPYSVRYYSEGVQAADMAGPARGCVVLERFRRSEGTDPELVHDCEKPSDCLLAV